MKPRVVLSDVHEQCVTFAWNDIRDYYVGYRFLEHKPRVLDTPPFAHNRQPICSLGELPPIEKDKQPLAADQVWNDNWLSSYHERDLDDPVQLTFQAYSDGSAWCVGLDNGGKQTREFCFQPADEGIWMWMRLTTNERIAGACCVQQCLRYTGSTNAPWRQAIARTPFLSEFDMQAMGNPNESLTYVRKDGGWFRFPVQHVVYVTAGDYRPLAESRAEEIDFGLIVRETLDRRVAPPSYWEQVAPGLTWGQIATGMYWERGACVSNRHPADCIHAWVDFGPLEAGQSRTLHGKFYFIEGSKDELLELWKRDFPSDG